jgi:uncharacterized protein YciI
VRRKRVVVRFRAGPAWEGGSPEHQPGWDDHAAFVDALIASGTVVMGGPFADSSGAMVLFEDVGEADARRIVAQDPFVANGVFVLEDIRAWTIYVDELTDPR